MNAVAQILLDECARRFGRASFLVRAPGRVNLIGEHTDYTGGFVLPMAIDRSTWIAGVENSAPEIILHSLDYAETASIPIAELPPGRVTGWVAYAHGVVGALAKKGHAIRGWKAVVRGEVPIGAGLASSASFTMANARACAAVSGEPWDPLEMAKVCLDAEQHWIGLNCGIMDQLISACGIAGHALLVDCRHTTFEPVPIPDSVRFVIMDTSKRRGLAESAYNEREAQCRRAAESCGVSELRDATAMMLGRAKLDDVTRRRAMHVIGENQRTLEAAEAMREGDLTRLGRLMNLSHESLRNDFEVSCSELDTIVEIAQRHVGCLGARMTGAGFGGCAIAMVRDHDGTFESAVTVEYQRRTGRTPNVFPCESCSGASREL